MANFDLNLSTRPFPAYRMANLLLAGFLAILVVISAWQAYGFVQYSSLAGPIRSDERSASAEAEALGKRVAELGSRLDRPEAAAKLSEIGFLNQLIARKDISWARLFANLEDMVPQSVRLVSLRPSVPQT